MGEMNASPLAEYEILIMGGESGDRCIEVRCRSIRLRKGTPL